MTIAIVGSGPAALMAADTLSQNGISVTIFEKRKTPGRKLLVAGSSGLNITNDLPLEKFISHYTGPKDLWNKWITDFDSEKWIRHIEQMGIKTFLGSSGRYFIEDKKAAGFLNIWIEKLKSHGVCFEFGKECTGFKIDDSQIELIFESEVYQFDSVFFALGGGSWEPNEKPLHWPNIFKEHRIEYVDFKSSNVGYKVSWSKEFLKEAEGLPLKRIVATSSRGSRSGDAMITQYGIEGTPIYFTGEIGKLSLDLKPDLTAKEIKIKLNQAKENLSPLRRIQKYLNLCDASLALLFHLTTDKEKKDIDLMIQKIKNFELKLIEPQPLDEAISSSGGVCLTEMDSSLMLLKFPGIFLGGEMLDWDAPTGGFLIQACVAQGYTAANGMLKYLKILISKT